MPPVNVGIEIDPFFFDPAQGSKRKDLKTAAVGKDRTIPGHKAVQSAHITDQTIARANMQMVGIGELDLAADLL